MSNPKNQAERAPILLSRAWSGLDTSFHEISFASHQLLHRRETVGAQAEGNLNKNRISFLFGSASKISFSFFLIVRHFFVFGLKKCRLEKKMKSYERAKGKRRLKLSKVDDECLEAVGYLLARQ